MHGTKDKNMLWLEVRPEKERLLGRSRHGQDDDIKINLKEIGWQGVEWIYLALVW